MAKIKAARQVGVFSQNLGITAYTLQGYSNFKSIFSFNSRSIFEILDCFKNSGKASFDDLSQLMN